MEQNKDTLEKKVAEKTEAPAKTAKNSKKAATKTTKASAAKTTKAAEKKAPAKRTKTAPVVTIETLTTAMWKVFEAADVSAFNGTTVTAQINVADLGVFYIALNAKADQPKEIMPNDYYLASVTIDTNAGEIKKIAAGGYDYFAALKTGALVAHGNVAKFLILTEIFK